MKTLALYSAGALLAATLFVRIVCGGPAASKAEVRSEKDQEVAVFVTGSLIPQRVKVKRTGTTTVSPVRVIDRREIDETGRHTTPGVLIDEPSVRVIGH